jgi:outer membrane protein TolC
MNTVRVLMLAGLTLASFAPVLAAAHQPVADSVLTLAEVYRLARAHNPMLQTAQATARAVAAQEGSATLPPDPEVQLGVMSASLPGLETNMPTSMVPSFQVMQMVPLPGKLALSGRIARQSTAMADAEVEEMEWEVRARAAMSFYEIYRIDRQLVVMRETVRLLKGFQQVARAMYSSGEGRQSDVLRASV